jgi:hypothetical protein
MFTFLDFYDRVFLISRSGVVGGSGVRLIRAVQLFEPVVTVRALHVRLGKAGKTFC